MRFKKGDRVKVKRFKERPNNWNDSGMMDHLMGKNVIITCVYTHTMRYEIYDEVHHREWYLAENDVEPVNESIVIYRKDNRVIALDKSTGNKAEARCCPEDTFNFETGAKLAFERLFAEPLFEPKKLYNGRIIFIKGDDVFKTGHIYEVKDGQIEDPCYGIMMPQRDKPLRDLEDVKDFFTSTSSRKRCGGWSYETLELIEVKND